MRKYRGFRKPYRIKNRKSIWRSQIFWNSVLLLIILGLTFYLFLFSQLFQIKELIITGNQKVSRKDIEAIVENTLEKKALFLKTRSIFLTNFTEINNLLLKEFTQIENISLKRNFPDVIEIKIRERKAVAVFSQDEDYFLLDKWGIIFEPLSNDILKEGELFQKPIITNLTLPTEIKLGEKAIAKDVLEQILDIEISLSKNLKIPLNEMVLVSKQRLEVLTKEGWQIYFNLEKDLNWQIAELITVLEEKISLQRRKNLKYIDLRFERIFIGYQ